MKKTAIIAGVAAAAMLTVGLLGCSVSSSTGGDVTFGEGGIDVASYSNSELTITLDANETTGYSWTATIDPEDGAELTGEEYSTTTTTTNDELTGVGGTQTYVYKFSAAGTYTISLTYGHSWEAQDDDLHYSLTVTTDSSGNITELAAAEA